MKRLFYCVLAITLGTFAFISCNDDDKLDNGKNEGKDGGKYMTLTQQQQAIQTSLEGLADAIEFTEFSSAIETVSGVMGRELSQSDFSEMLMSQELAQDSIFQFKFFTALAMFAQDTVVLDLTPLYMKADLFMKDTVIVDSVRYLGEGGNVFYSADTINKTLLTLTNIDHNADCLQLNVFVDGHEIVLKAQSQIGENKIAVTDEKGVEKTVILPRQGEISITLDGKNLATIKGQLNSDMSIFVKQVEDANDIVEAEGSKASISGSIKVVDYELGGLFNYEMSKGMDGNFTVKYADSELLSATGKIDAVFDDLDLNDSTAIIIWAQNPELLKSATFNASMGKGKVEVKCTVDNPFKDEELATTLRSLLVPGAVLSEQKAKQTIDKLNEFINAGVYFEGYKEPQAKFKFVYDDRDNVDSGKDAHGNADDEEAGIFDAIKDKFRTNRISTVFVVRNDKGEEETVPVDNYFLGVDITKAQQTVYEKFIAAFASLIQTDGTDDEDGADEGEGGLLGTGRVV